MSTDPLTGCVTERAPSLRRAVVIQARVVRALLLRELITRFGRRNLGVLWLIIEPALFTLAVATLWNTMGLKAGSNLPIIPFAITGYSSVLLWRNTVTHCTNAIHQNLNLLYHRNVRLLDVLAARILLEVCGATASFSVLTGFFVLIDEIEPPNDLLTVVWGWLLLTWFGAALGLTMGALSAFSEIVQRLWQPLSYVLFPLSGAAFMVGALPPEAREALLWLPMVHGVEIVRDGYFGHLVRTYHDAGYLAVCSLVLTLAGLFLLRVAARRVETR